jgi:predicted ATPase
MNLANQFPRRIVISGCSGGGKSTLLEELSARGHHVFAEAGREIVQEQLAHGGTALPWEDAPKFVEILLERSLSKFHAAPMGLSFYDRSFIEPLRWYRATGNPLPEYLSDAAHLRYGDDVFLAPPWPEIHRQDDERRHDFAAAVEATSSDRTPVFPKASCCARAMPSFSGRVRHPSCPSPSAPSR